MMCDPLLFIVLYSFGIFNLEIHAFQYQESFSVIYKVESYEIAYI